MSKENTFTASNLRDCEEYVISLQRQLDETVIKGDTKSIHRLFDLLTKRSKAVKILATNRITRINSGKYTAGIDGIATPKDRYEANHFRLDLLNDIDVEKKPDLIKRGFIPKSDGKQRPLGIPTIQDRIVQEIIRTGLEPIVEYNFHEHSYGFRPKRSCQDAMSHLYIKLSRKISPRYVIEGDIKGCFDNIRHSHILRTLDFWQVPHWAINVIRAMLKTGILYENKVYANNAGTPQGGVISPMLANVALTSFDFHCQNFAENTSNPLVRYADDFVITCVSEKKGKQIKADITDFLAETSGLTLSDKKTAITHISKGFNFLGFHFKKYKPNGYMGNWTDEKLLIRPQPEKVVDFLRNIAKDIRKLNNVNQDTLISILNPKLRGFGMYYRHCVSQVTFNKIDYHVWNKLLKWAKRKHRKLKTKEIVRRYFHYLDGNKTLLFSDTETGSHIFQLKRIPIRRFKKIKTGYRIFDKSEETTTYWQKRETENCLFALNSRTRRTLYTKQKGKCYHCNRPFIVNEILDAKVDTHHIIPKKLGGGNEINNLSLVHETCHHEIHSRQ